MFPLRPLQLGGIALRAMRERHRHAMRAEHRRELALARLEMIETPLQ
jgi:hypothetical protein